MRGREGKGGAPPTDLLVCFPSRTRLALMPKPSSSSPNRPSDPSKRRNHHQLVRSNNRVGHGSPVLWVKTKSDNMGSEMDEPTSPKVTCAGQIKVQSKNKSCKNWQAVMEEIEKLHRNGKQKKKKPTWVEALGLKKDVTQFLSCLRGIKLDLQCFGSFHQSVLSSEDEDEEEDEEEEKEEEKDQFHSYEEEQHHEGDLDAEASGSSQTFSKWFMVLEEKHDDQYCKEEDEDDVEEAFPCAPPPNALLLMRCRSAPAKTWLEEKLLQEQEDKAQKVKLDAEEEKENKENLILKFYAPDFKVSSDIAKETWVVGGARDPLPRSRSWKR